MFPDEGKDSKRASLPARKCIRGVVGRAQRGFALAREQAGDLWVWERDRAGLVDPKSRAAC